MGVCKGLTGSRLRMSGVIRAKFTLQNRERHSVVITNNNLTEIRNWYFDNRYRHTDKCLSNTRLYLARFVIGFVRGLAFVWGVNNCHDNLISHIEVNAKWSM
jgi:hypothetical protein